MTETFFSEAAEVQAMAERLMREEGEFLQIRDSLFVYGFIDPPQKKNEREVYGTAEVIRGKNAFLYWQAKGKTGSAAFYRIIIAEALWRELDAKQREFVIRHELRHCTLKRVNKQLRKKIRAHGIGLFLADLKDPVMEDVIAIWETIHTAQHQRQMDFGEPETIFAGKTG